MTAKPSVLDWLEKRAALADKKHLTCHLYTKAFDRLCDELGASREQNAVLVSFDAGAVVQRRVFVVRTQAEDLPNGVTH